MNPSAEHLPIYSLAECDVEPRRVRALDFAAPKTPCALALDPGNPSRRRAGASPSPLPIPTPSTSKPRRGDADFGESYSVKLCIARVPDLARSRGPLLRRAAAGQRPRPRLDHARRAAT